MDKCSECHQVCEEGYQAAVQKLRKGRGRELYLKVDFRTTEGLIEMISRAERKQRKAKANEAVVFAYSAMKNVDELLDFNKQLRNKASDIKFRLILLHEKLTSCTQRRQNP